MMRLLAHTRLYEQVQDIITPNVFIRIDGMMIRHPKKSSPVTNVSQGRPVSQTFSIRALAFLT